MNKNLIIADKLEHIDQVLDTEQFQELYTEIAETNLLFEQIYPRRLFTTRKHMPWLIEYFQPLVASVRPDAHVQQMFMSIELPGSEFLLHKNHNNLGQVICFSLNTVEFVRFRAVTSNTDKNYFSSVELDSLNLNYLDIDFKENRAIVTHGSELVWGFSKHVPSNHCLRLIWIYLSA
jgi:hypothetical protein